MKLTCVFRSMWSQWAEVDSLIKELQEVDGVQAVSKGRYFLSPGLAPTFQVTFTTPQSFLRCTFTHCGIRGLRDL